MQTVNAPADVICAPGTVLMDNKCASLVGKRQVCPIGFEEEEDACLRRKHASPEVQCPDGYVLVSKDQVSLNNQSLTFLSCAFNVLC